MPHQSAQKWFSVPGRSLSRLICIVLRLQSTRVSMPLHVLWGLFTKYPSMHYLYLCLASLMSIFRSVCSISPPKQQHHIAIKPGFFSILLNSTASEQKLIQSRTVEVYSSKSVLKKIPPNLCTQISPAVLMQLTHSKPALSSQLVCFCRLMVCRMVLVPGEMKSDNSRFGMVQLCMPPKMFVQLAW